MSRETALAAIQSLTEEKAALLKSDPDLLARFKAKHGLDQPQAATPSQSTSLAGRAWDALAIPEQKSREGLQMLAQMSAPKTEVTGNLARDVAVNIPKIGLETLSETAPSFVSRGAILTAGALKAAQAARPALSFIRKGTMGVLEKTSGIAPRQAGALEAEYKDPLLIFAKGKKAAGKFYEAAKNETANIFQGKTTAKEVVKAAQKYLDKGGKLEPIEALTARKATDAMLQAKGAVKDTLVPLRKTLDAIAKSDANISAGDAAVARGAKAAAIRFPFPTNIGGTFSSFRTGIGGGLAALVPGGKAIAAAGLSPLVQGVGAGALGTAAKLATPLINNPITAAGAVEVSKKIIKTLSEEKAKDFLKKAKGDRDKARKMAQKAGYDIPIVE